jgi:hypothetical protein
MFLGSCATLFFDPVKYPEIRVHLPARWAEEGQAG